MQHPNRGLAALCALVFAGSPACAQDWKPAKTIEVVVSSGAGGAADRQARTLQKFLQAMPGMPNVTVNNRPGGGGTVAWTYLAQQPGDAHYVATMNTAIVTNRLLGLSTLRYEDLTPLSIMMREYVGIWVRTGSSIQTAKDLVARLRADPASVSFGLSPALGNQNHIVIGMLARAAGIDPLQAKIVVYSSGGQGMTAALGGHVEVWVGAAGGLVPYLAAGTIRPLGVSSQERQPGKIAVIPTFREQGIDAVYYAWRGIVAPGKLSGPQVAFWDQVFAGIVKSDEWAKAREDNVWGADLRGAAETRRHLDAETELLRKMLVDLGVLKK